MHKDTLITAAKLNSEIENLKNHIEEISKFDDGGNYDYTIGGWKIKSEFFPCGFLADYIKRAKSNLYCLEVKFRSL